MTKGPYFPTCTDPPGASMSDLLAAERNHPSFNETHGEKVSPGLKQALDTANRGFGQLFTHRAAAERILGPTFPAPLGNVRRLKADGLTFKNRLILDLKANRANSLVQLCERVVLPRGIDHARDLAQLSAGPQFLAPSSHYLVTTLVLDYKDAFHQIPLMSEEVRFYCADLGDAGFLAFYGMGFGGRAFPLVFGRVISFVARATQAMFPPTVARLQTYVDDPVLSVAGSPEKAEEVFDTAILLWLLLGADLSWEKGTVSTAEHTWIGISFRTVGREAIMEITPSSKKRLFRLWSPFGRGGGMFPAVTHARR